MDVVDVVDAVNRREVRRDLARVESAGAPSSRMRPESRTTHQPRARMSSATSTESSGSIGIQPVA